MVFELFSKGIAILTWNFLRNAPEKIRAEKKTAMSLSTDEQMFRIDHRLTILLFMVIQIFYSQQYQSAETSKKSSIFNDNGLSDRLASFFYAILHEDAQTMQNARFTCFKHLFSIQCVTSHLQCMLFTDMKLSIHLVSLFCFEKLNAFASWRLQQSHGSSVILMLFVVLQRQIDYFNVMAQHRLISMQSSLRLRFMYLWHHR